MDIRSTSAYTAPAAPLAANNQRAAPAAANSGVKAVAPGQGADAVKQAEPAPNAEQLSQALKSINSALQVRSQDLEFSVDHESARTIVTVTDKSTHEVIRQMPTKEAMEIAKALDRLQSLLIKQTA